MMSMLSLWFSVLKSREPDLAIVPRFFSSSSFVMPMPLSVMVSVRLSLSGWMWIFRSSFVMPMDVSVKLLK